MTASEEYQIQSLTKICRALVLKLGSGQVRLTKYDMAGEGTLLKRLEIDTRNGSEDIILKVEL